MDDSDDHGDSGLSGYAWYQLGKSEGQAAHVQQSLFEALTGRAPVARAHYDDIAQQRDALAYENEWLWSEVAKANAWLREWKDKFEAFKAHADQQAAKLAEVTARSNKQAEELKQALEWLNEAEAKIFNLDKAYFEATGESPPDWVNETDE
jgi:chromosome segregation ATPase